MSFINIVKKQLILFLAVGIILNFTSCGSFQYAGTYEDSIYSESNPEEQKQEKADNFSNSSEYYKNYFKEKSLNLEGMSSTYSDSENTDSENTDSENYAGWGQNNSTDITINIYDTTPFYGLGWGSPFYNNWNRGMGFNGRWNMGWNMGWNSYGYVMDPFGNNYGYQYIPWGNNYWNYGFPNYGYYGFPNYGYGSYYGYGTLNINRGSSVSYVNGPRGSRYANNTSSRRTASNSSTIKKLTTRSNTTSRNLNNSRKSEAPLPSNIALALAKKKERKKTSSWKQSSTRKNTKSSNNNSSFPKAVKMPSSNRSYSSPSSTTRPSSSSRNTGARSRSKRK
jgi:hypothetical protein